MTICEKACLPLILSMFSMCNRCRFASLNLISCSCTLVKQMFEYGVVRLVSVHTQQQSDSYQEGKTGIPNEVKLHAHGYFKTVWKSRNDLSAATVQIMIDAWNRNMILADLILDVSLREICGHDCNRPGEHQNPDNNGKWRNDFAPKCVGHHIAISDRRQRDNSKPHALWYGIEITLWVTFYQVHKGTCQRERAGERESVWLEWEQPVLDRIQPITKWHVILSFGFHFLSERSIEKESWTSAQSGMRKNSHYLTDKEDADSHEYGHHWELTHAWT